MDKKSYENGVLGSLTIDASLFTTETPDIEIKLFSGENKGYFEKLKKYREKNEVFDMGDFMNETGATMKEVTSYMEQAIVSTAFDTYLTKLRQLKLAEDVTAMLIRASHAVEEDPYKAEEVLTTIGTLAGQNHTGFKGQAAPEVIQSVIDRVKHSIETGEKPFVVPGIKGLDKYVELEEGQLVIIAARPGVGKSAFALNLLRKLLKIRSVTFVGFEMTNYEVGLRLVIREAMHPRDFLYSKQGLPILEGIKEEVEKMQNNCTFYDHGMTVEDLAGVIRYEKKKHNMQFFIVDYLGLLTTKKKAGTTYEELKHITRQLKIYASNYGVTIIALSQLNREVEKRASKTFKLSDLRDSGSLENDANIVMFLERGQEKTGGGAFSESEVETDLQPDEMRVHIKKVRSGAPGEVVLKYIPELYYIDAKETYASQTAMH